MKNDVTATSILVRKWQKEDIQALLTLGKDKNMRIGWEYSYPYTMKKAEACIQFFLHADPFRYVLCAIFVHHRLCGWIQTRVVYYQCGEITFWLKHEYHQSDMLYEIFTQMCQISFASLDILTVYTKTTMDQYSLQQALRRVGFFENIETAPIYLYYLHSFIFTKRYARPSYQMPF